MSIIEIVKTLRKAEIFLSSKYITSDMKEDFFEDEKNFVDLDTTSPTIINFLLKTELPAGVSCALKIIESV